MDSWHLLRWLKPSSTVDWIFRNHLSPLLIVAGRSWEWVWCHWFNGQWKYHIPSSIQNTPFALYSLSPSRLFWRLPSSQKWMVRICSSGKSGEFSYLKFVCTCGNGLKRKFRPHPLPEKKNMVGSAEIQRTVDLQCGNAGRMGGGHQREALREMNVP